MWRAHLCPGAVWSVLIHSLREHPERPDPGWAEQRGRCAKPDQPGLGRAEGRVPPGPTRNWERRGASDSVLGGEMARGISPAASDGSSARSTPWAKHALPGTLGPPAAPESQGGAGSSSHRATIVLTSPLEALALALPSATLLSPVPQAPPSGLVGNSMGAASPRLGSGRQQERGVGRGPSSSR